MSEIADRVVDSQPRLPGSRLAPRKRLAPVHVDREIIPLRPMSDRNALAIASQLEGEDGAAWID